MKLVAAKLFMKLFEIRSKENYIYPEKMQIEVVEEEITRIKTHESKQNFINYQSKKNYKLKLKRIQM